MVQNSQQGSAEGDEHLPDGMGILSDFDFSDPESVAQVGHRLIDEYDQIAKRFPNASKAQDEAEGDVDVFLETVDLDAERHPDCVIRERIRWVNDALRAWVELVANTGMDTYEEIGEALDRIVIDSIRDIHD
jgi:hypothetical protein